MAVNNLTDKRVLVTGGAGFVGSHVVDLLMQEGCRVRVVDDLSLGRPENIAHHLDNRRFEFTRGDILDNDVLSAILKGIDIVFHHVCLGARQSINDPFRSHQINAGGTLAVLMQAKGADIKKFILSSAEVYGNAEYVPMDERHPIHPRTIYGASKLAGEAYATAYHKAYGLPIAVLRLFNAYGPRSHYEDEVGELIPKSIVRALNNEPLHILGDGLQTRDFSYVEDTAAAIVLAAKHDETVGRALNVGNDMEISIKDVAGKILNSMTESSSTMEYLPGRPGDVTRYYSDSRQFRDMTGWKPRVSFDRGLLKTIEWFRTRPDVRKPVPNQ